MGWTAYVVGRLREALRGAHHNPPATPRAEALEQVAPPLPAAPPGRAPDALPVEPAPTAAAGGSRAD